MAPGETAQFTAILRLSDGSGRDVTNDTTWQSRTSLILSVSATGAATGLQHGDGSISAFYRAEGALNATKEVIVVPVGTYRLAGIVSEAGVPPVPVAGARVDVTAGTGAGLFTTTGDDGRYRLYGVSGDAQIRVTKSGYEPNVQSMPVLDHLIQNFELTLSKARMDVAGTYTLTITAADDCRGKLPDDVRVRTYTAVVTQQGPQLEATLTGATFANNKTGRGNRFSGRVEPGQVTFSLNLKPYYNYYPYVPDYYPDVVEQLASGYLIVSGSVVVSASGPGLSGTLDGSIAIWARDPREGTRQETIASCGSARHRFVLSR